MSDADSPRQIRRDGPPPERMAAPQAVATPAPTGAAPSEKPVEQLSPEEQMARFAQQLKEEDWGHQPC